jgi:hypothetical protein
MCFSASGQYVPPLIVFPRKNMKLELMNGTPPGCTHACHISGWIQQEIFVQWLRHFIQNVKPTKEDPVILDGHHSHTRNYEVVKLGRENDVIIICLPPHSTHKMQPLDVAFMSPFKTYYAQEITNWLRQNPGRVVTVYQIGELFSKAYMRAATLETAIHGFRKTGLYPCNRDIFRAHDFINKNVEEEQLEVAANVVERLEIEAVEREQENVIASERTVHRCAELTPTQKHGPNVTVTPVDIIPLPVVTENIVQRKKARTGKPVVVTGTPHKEELESSLLKKNTPSTSGVQRKLMIPKKKKC